MTVTKTTTRKKGGTGDKRDALELKTSGKRVRRMMGASAVRMREVFMRRPQLSLRLVSTGDGV